MTAPEDVDRGILERLALLTPDETSDAATWRRLGEVFGYWFTYAERKRSELARAEVLATHPELALDAPGPEVDVPTGGRL